MTKKELKEWFDNVIKHQDIAYDWANVPYGPDYRVAEAVLKLLEEYETLQKTLEKYEFTCPECKLEYHEWDCVVDGQQTGERYKVAVCKNCNYQRDIE